MTFVASGRMDPHHGIHYLILDSPTQFNVIAKGIEHKLAFNWWVHHELRKTNRIISLDVRGSAQCLKRIHNFEIELPKTAEEDIIIDKKKKNINQHDSIAKEL